ncbi:MAG TPA: hypothetical protein VK961_26915 [Chthoniobacter sp.]|nr:hypothetical protein [Chthoniobacter sp.]
MDSLTIFGTAVGILFLAVVGWGAIGSGLKDVLGMRPMSDEERLRRSIRKQAKSRER